MVPCIIGLQTWLNHNASFGHLMMAERGSLPSKSMYRTYSMIDSTVAMNSLYLAWKRLLLICIVLVESRHRRCRGSSEGLGGASVIFRQGCYPIVDFESCSF